MGTEVSVYLWNHDAEAGGAAIEAVFQEAARIDRLMSTYRDDSKISEINRQAASAPVSTDIELFKLIERSLDISVLTLGAFDISYESVGQHYDFRSRQRPDADTLQSELAYIDYRLIKLDRDASSVHFLEDGVRINLVEAVKGYMKHERETLEGVIECLARKSDFILGAGELFLKLHHILIGFEIGISFGQRE